MYLRRNNILVGILFVALLFPMAEAFAQGRPADVPRRVQLQVRETLGTSTDTQKVVPPTKTARAEIAKKNINIRGKALAINQEQKEIQVQVKDKTYTVVITDKTVFTRRFFGRTTLRALGVGDAVMIVGRLLDQDTIEAKNIRDLSTWKIRVRQGKGIIKEVNTEAKTFTITRGDTKDAKVITVVVAADTKLFAESKIGRKRELVSIALEQLSSGDRVRLTGIFNKNTDMLAAETVVVLK